MTGEERRKKIIETLRDAKVPVSGGRLAKANGVSRQVIVQDIALIRAQGVEIASTYRGYTISGQEKIRKVFKVIHSDIDTEKELTLIVDLGGQIEDVFVYHKVYGVIRGSLNLRSRRDIELYMEQIRSGKSTLLMTTTSGYHYHTVTADTEETMMLIEEKLKASDFLAPLQDYEPQEVRTE